MSIPSARGNRLEVRFRNDLLMSAASRGRLPRLESQHRQEESGEAE